jgi:hypothetical protein
LVETSEDLVGRNGRNFAGIHVLDAALDLVFPVFPQASKPKGSPSPASQRRDGAD